MWKGDNQARLRSGGPLLLLLDRPPDWSRLAATFERISRLFPRLRQRIVSTPFELSKPRWAVDERFDLSYHVRRLALPAPATLDQLLDVLAPDASAGFDPLRPPWVVTVYEGLADDRAALVLRPHHALFDGRGMIQVFERGFDRSRRATATALPPAPAAQVVNEIALLRSALAPARLLAAARAQIATARTRPRRSPIRAVSQLRDVLRSFEQLMGGSTPQPSALLAGRSNSVRLGMLEMDFESLRAAAKAVGGSLNDALLTIVAGAVGQYHQDRGEPVESLNVAFPVSVRTASDDPVGGNRIGGAMIAAPVALPDPAERLRRIRELVLDARDDGASQIVEALTTVLYLLPSWLIAAVPLMDRVDVQVSNFSGLTERRYIGGAEVIGSYGFGPHPGTPMMIVMMSHVGTCCVAVNVDAAAIDDMPALMSFLRSSRDEVLALGKPVRRARPLRSG